MGAAGVHPATPRPSVRDLAATFGSTSQGGRAPTRPPTAPSVLGGADHRHDTPIIGTIHRASTGTYAGADRFSRTKAASAAARGGIEDRVVQGNQVRPQPLPGGQSRQTQSRPPPRPRAQMGNGRSQPGTVADGEPPVSGHRPVGRRSPPGLPCQPPQGCGRNRSHRCQWHPNTHGQLKEDVPRQAGRRELGHPQPARRPRPLPASM